MLSTNEAMCHASDEANSNFNHAAGFEHAHLNRVISVLPIIETVVKDINVTSDDMVGDN